MPWYSYSRMDEAAAKVTVERWYRMGRAPKCVRLKTNGQVQTFRRDIPADFQPQPNRRIPKYPCTLWAAGVHPSQRGELVAELRKNGLKTEVSAEGDPVVYSPGEMKKVLKATGMVDLSRYA